MSGNLTDARSTISQKYNFIFESFDYSNEESKVQLQDPPAKVVFEEI